MRLKYLLFTLVLFATTNGLSQSSDADSKQMTVFGFELGKPLRLPPCPDPGSVTPSVGSTPCLHKWGAAYMIGIPPKEKSLYIDGELSVDFVDGDLGKIRFNTHGLISQDAVLKLLKDKYGTPTVYLPQSGQNAFGAKFNSFGAVWQFANLTVIFAGIVARTDQGFVTFETPQFTKFDKERDAKKPTEKRPL